MVKVVSVAHAVIDATGSLGDGGVNPASMAKKNTVSGVSCTLAFKIG